MSKMSREKSRRHAKGRRLRDKERLLVTPAMRRWQFAEARARYQDLRSGFSALDRKFMRPEFGY